MREPSDRALPGREADSFGTPWAGRTLAPQPFAGDDGRADPVLAAALQGYAAQGSPSGWVDPSRAAVVSALAPARVMAAVRAVIGDEHPLPTHNRGDAGADMGLAVLTGADGRRALPVFTGIAELAAWDGAARPVPVEAARAAQAAVAEGCDTLLLDPAGPVPFLVPRAVLWALAQGRAWHPPAMDDDVTAAVTAAVGSVSGVHGEPAVRGVRCESGRQADLVVVIGVVPGLTQPDLEQLLARVSDALAQAPVIAERVDSLALSVLSA